MADLVFTDESLKVPFVRLPGELAHEDLSAIAARRSALLDDGVHDALGDINHGLADP